MKVLQELDRSLSYVRPQYYRSLNPGLSAAQINTICSDFSHAIPEQLCSMYQWKNGQDSSITASFLRYEHLTFSSLELAFADKEIVDEYLGEAGHKLTGKLLPFMGTGGNQWLCAASGMLRTRLFVYSGDEALVEPAGGLNGLLSKAVKELRGTPFPNKVVDISVSEIEYRKGVEIAVDAVLRIGDASRKITLSRYWHGAAEALVIPFKSATEEAEFYGGLDPYVITQILEELAELVLPESEKLGVEPDTGKPDFDPMIRVSPERKEAAEIVFSGAVYRFEINTWIKE